MDTHTISNILIKLYGKGHLDGEDLTILNNWLDQDPANRELFERLNDPEQREEFLRSIQNERESIYERLKAQIKFSEPNPQPPFRHRRVYKWSYAVAASIIVAIVSTILIFVLNNRRASTTANNSHVLVAESTPVVPGRDKAILTLSDGKEIELTSTANGTLATDSDVSITQDSTGTVVYKPNLNGAHTDAYNTITTPRGGQYKIVLPDGSNVWLNAESTLKFPVSFTGNTRPIILNGEALFAVKKIAHQPFVVRTKSDLYADKELDITVLGTEFNVSAYAGKQTTTTLINGAIKINHGKKEIFVKPMQGVTFSDGRFTTENNADLEEILDWKNGFIVAKDANIKDFVDKLARWYDIDVQVQAGNNKKYYFKISKHSSITEIINVLKAAGIDAELHERMLTIK